MVPERTLISGDSNTSRVESDVTTRPCVADFSPPFKVAPSPVGHRTWAHKSQNANCRLKIPVTLLCCLVLCFWIPCMCERPKSSHERCLLSHRAHGPVEETLDLSVMISDKAYHASVHESLEQELHSSGFFTNCNVQCAMHRWVSTAVFPSWWKSWSQE